MANDSGQDSQGALARAITLGLFPALQEGCQIFMKEAALESATASTGMLPPSVYRIMQDFGHTREDAELWLSRCR